MMNIEIKAETQRKAKCTLENVERGFTFLWDYNASAPEENPLYVVASAELIKESTGHVMVKCYEIGGKIETVLILVKHASGEYSEYVPVDADLLITLKGV